MTMTSPSVPSIKKTSHIKQEEECFIRFLNIENWVATTSLVAVFPLLAGTFLIISSRFCASFFPRKKSMSATVTYWTSLTEVGISQMHFTCVNDGFSFMWFHTSMKKKISEICEQHSPCPPMSNIHERGRLVKVGSPSIPSAQTVKAAVNPMTVCTMLLIITS